jgi:2-iminobutanoate/2-iminopropanoate deaminase
MPRHSVSAPGAPGAIGPYSQAIEIDGFLFCSGQLGLDPATGQLLDGIDAQT